MNGETTTVSQKGRPAQSYKRTRLLRCTRKGMELFDSEESSDAVESAPLADRMRPQTFDEVLGQEDVIGKGKPIRSMVERGEVPSMIFWGPPGSGKTTIARIIASETDEAFVPFSAVTSGVEDVRTAVREARLRRDSEDRGTLLFLDEIHRFNKAQQDAFLPHVEDGTITLIGATTENPSFEVNQPLLSRCRVFTLSGLEDEHIRTIINRAVSDPERGFGDRNVELTEGAMNTMVRFAGGDARKALNLLELTVVSKRSGEENGDISLAVDDVEEAAQQRTLHYDQDGEQHYNMISALHKSIRGSDPNASLYWLTRMLEGGEDPMYIARRIVRAAVEDVGLADPRAQRVALDAKDTYEFLGSPEGELALAQAAIYLSLAPKNDSVYAALNRARKEVRNGENPPVPLHIRNAVTDLMKEEGYGQNYRNPHHEPEESKKQSYLPEELDDLSLYDPNYTGLEEQIVDRFKEWYRSNRKEGDA